MAGQTARFIRRLEAEMREAAAAEEFERAARLRDDIQALQRALEKQAVVLGDGTDCDVIALAEDQLEAAVQVFYVRGGRVRGQRGWVVDKVEDVTPGELVEQFLGQVYGETAVHAADRERRAGRRGEAARGSGVSRARCLSRCCRRTPGRGGVAGGPPRQPGQPAGTAARRQEGAAGDRGAQRQGVAGAAQDAAGQRPDHPQPGPARDPGGARPGRGAAADRVLRRVQPAGNQRRRVHGRVRGRPGPQERVPQVQHQGHRRHRRRRLDPRGHHPAVPAVPGRTGGDRRTGLARRSRAGPGGIAAERDAASASASSPTRRTWWSSTAARPRSMPPSGRWTNWASTTSPSAGWPSGWRRCGCPARMPRSSCRAAARACTCCSGSETRHTGSPSPTTGQSGQRPWR